MKYFIRAIGYYPLLILLFLFVIMATIIVVLEYIWHCNLKKKKYWKAFFTEYFQCYRISEYVDFVKYGKESGGSVIDEELTY